MEYTIDFNEIDQRPSLEDGVRATHAECNPPKEDDRTLGWFAKFIRRLGLV